MLERIVKYVDDLKLKMCLSEAYPQGSACLRQLLLVMKSGNLPMCSFEAKGANVYHMLESSR